MSRTSARLMVRVTGFLRYPPFGQCRAKHGSKEDKLGPLLVRPHPYHPFSSHTLRKRSGPSTWALIATIEP